MVNENQTQNDASRAATYIVVALILIVAIIIFLAYWNNRAVDNDLDGEIGEDNGTSEELVSDILENPAVYVGQTVTVVGDAEELIGDQAFVLDTFGVTDDKILVIGRTPLVEMVVNEDDERIGIEEGDDVTIGGTIRVFSVADIETEIGMNLEENLFVQFENLPAIVADTVVNAG